MRTGESLKWARGRARFRPGCGVRFGQGHHIRHWAHGGPTTLSNLAMLCRRHHRAVHEEGYQVERLSDGALRFRWPDGRLLHDVPPLPAIPDDPVQSLRARNAAGTWRRSNLCKVYGRLIGYPCGLEFSQKGHGETLARLVPPAVCSPDRRRTRRRGTTPRPARTIDKGARG